MAGVQQRQREREVGVVHGPHDRPGGVPAVASRESLVGEQGRAVLGAESSIARLRPRHRGQDALGGVVADLLGGDVRQPRQIDGANPCLLATHTAIILSYRFYGNFKVDRTEPR
jgi:hypothetical protein